VVGLKSLRLGQAGCVYCCCWFVLLYLLLLLSSISFCVSYVIVAREEELRVE